MIGLTRLILAIGVGGVAGVVLKPVAARFAAEATPSLWISIALQSAVAASACLLAPTGLLPVSLGLGCALVLLAMIDALVFRLPDIFTLPLVLCGLLVTEFQAPSALFEHVVGAAAGYGLLALVAGLYRRMRGREGLGLGDAKLLACAGAWLGWRPLPLVLLAAALGGIVWAVVARLKRGSSAWRDPVPFGVPLAFSIWTVWLVAAQGAAL